MHETFLQNANLNKPPWVSSVNKVPPQQNSIGLVNEAHAIVSSTSQPQQDSSDSVSQPHMGLSCMSEVNG
jgi:hypothetical protein